MGYQRKMPKIPGKPKSKNSILYAVVIAILTVVALISGRLSVEYGPQMDKQEAAFQVHVMDVGQGDSILVLADGHAMLIDGSESAAAPVIQEYLTEQGVTQLDYVIATHLHADHIGGLPNVIKAFPPKNVAEPICSEKLLPVTSVYERYLDAVEASGAAYKTMKAGDHFQVGSANVTVLGPVSEDAKDLNNTSLVLRVQYRDCICIFVGDMEEAEEKTILAGNFDLDADFLKVGHHGSDTSSSEAFLAAVTPEYAAISCGKDNTYGHPGKETLQRLENYAQKISVTAENGNIVFLYDPATGKKGIVNEK